MFSAISSADIFSSHFCHVALSQISNLVPTPIIIASFSNFSVSFSILSCAGSSFAFSFIGSNSLFSSNVLGSSVVSFSVCSTPIGSSPSPTKSTCSVGFSSSTVVSNASVLGSVSISFARAFWSSVTSGVVSGTSTFGSSSVLISFTRSFWSSVTSGVVSGTSTFGSSSVLISFARSFWSSVTSGVVSGTSTFGSSSVLISFVRSFWF